MLLGDSKQLASMLSLQWKNRNRLQRSIWSTTLLRRWFVVTLQAWIRFQKSLLWLKGQVCCLQDSIVNPTVVEVLNKVPWIVALTHSMLHWTLPSFCAPQSLFWSAYVKLPGTDMSWRSWRHFAPNANTWDQRSRYSWKNYGLLNVIGAPLCISSGSSSCLARGLDFVGWRFASIGFGTARTPKVPSVSEATVQDVPESGWSLPHIAAFHWITGHWMLLWLPPSRICW